VRSRRSDSATCAGGNTGCRPEGKANTRDGSEELHGRRVPLIAAMFTEIALYVAFTSLACWSVWVFRRQQRIIREVQRQKVKIQTEERRVFDFLHDIGEALAQETQPGDLHGSIVEGALRILEAQGGALYLTDKSGTQLRPAYISKGCPPFLELPPQPGSAHTTLQNQLKLVAVKIGDGPLGGVMAQKAPLFLLPDDLRLGPALAHGAVSAFYAPLIYAGHDLGVLAVARCGPVEPFTRADFQTFKALAEQSAFSLFDAILHHEANEKKQMEKDLRVANEVQRVLLPSESPKVEGYEIEGCNVPARYLSGDYFDYVPIDADRCGVVIADVSGKGMPAALLMAMCRGVLRLLAPGNESPAEVMRRLNAQLYPDIKEDMFISMAYAVVDRRNGTLQLSRAGHDAPVVYRASDGHVEMIKPPGMAVGIDSGGVFNRVTSDFSLRLEAGDCLVLYTDGVTEALDRHGEEFGLEAMKRAIQASAPEGAAAIVSRVAAEVRAFIGDHPQNDDITLIAIRKK
jgi:sigma-B regulation protein RsbU (phosphoserine phosphatase)